MSALSTNTSQEDLTLNLWVPNCLSDNRDRVIRNFNPQKSTLLSLPKGIEFHEQLFLTQPDVYILAWYTLILNPEIFAVNPISLHATVRKIDDIAMFQLKVPLSLESQLILLHIQVWCELMFPLLVIDLDASSMKIEDMVQSILLELFWDEWLLDKIINNKEFSLRIPNDDIYFKYKNTLLALLANYSILLIKRGEYEWWIEMIKIRYIIANALYNQTWVFLAHRDHCFALLERSWYILTPELAEQIQWHLSIMETGCSDLHEENARLIAIIENDKSKQQNNWTEFFEKANLKNRGQYLITKLLFDIACGYDPGKLPWMVSEWYELAILYGLYPPSSPANGEGGWSPPTIAPDDGDKTQMFWLELKLWEYCRMARWHGENISFTTNMSRLADKKLETDLVKRNPAHDETDSANTDSLLFSRLLHDDAQYWRQGLSIHLRSYIDTLRLLASDITSNTNYTSIGKQSGTLRTIKREQAILMALRIYEVIAWISNQDTRIENFFRRDDSGHMSPLAGMYIHAVSHIFTWNHNHPMSEVQSLGRLKGMYRVEQKRLESSHQEALAAIRNHMGLGGIGLEMKTWKDTWTKVPIETGFPEVQSEQASLFYSSEILYGGICYRFYIYPRRNNPIVEDTWLEETLQRLIPWIHKIVLENATQNGIMEIVAHVRSSSWFVLDSNHLVRSHLSSGALALTFARDAAAENIKLWDSETALKNLGDMWEVISIFPEILTILTGVDDNVMHLRELVSQKAKSASAWKIDSGPSQVQFESDFKSHFNILTSAFPEFKGCSINFVSGFNITASEYNFGIFMKICAWLLRKLTDASIWISEIRFELNDQGNFVCTFIISSEANKSYDPPDIDGEWVFVGGKKKSNDFFIVAKTRDWVIAPLI